MSDSTSYPVSPPDMQCIWMSAGVVRYQLCDRDFDCATCPIDKAMRNMAQNQGRIPSPMLGHRPAPLRLGRYYTQEHCWLSIRSPLTIRVGIEPNLALRCKGLQALTLPAPRRMIPARVPFAWCRFESGMVPARLPFAIRVTEVNHSLNKHPELVTEQPFDEGWLCEGEIDPSQLESTRVMSSWTAEKAYGADEAALHASLRDDLARRAETGVGRTAYDGGEPMERAIDVLGSAQYCALISRVYCKVT